MNSFIYCRQIRVCAEESVRANHWNNIKLLWEFIQFNGLVLLSSDAIVVLVLICLFQSLLIQIACVVPKLSWARTLYNVHANSYKEGHNCCGGSIVNPMFQEVKILARYFKISVPQASFSELS